MVAEAAADRADAEFCYYVLDDSKAPVPASKAEWMEMPNPQKLVARTELPNGGTVTTCFEGRSDTGDEERLLFSTYSLFCEDGLEEGAYPSWAEAEAGHRRVVARFEKLLGGMD